MESLPGLVFGGHVQPKPGGDDGMSPQGAEFCLEQKT